MLSKGGFPMVGVSEGFKRWATEEPGFYGWMRPSPDIPFTSLRAGHCGHYHKTEERAVQCARKKWAHLLTNTPE